MENKNNENRYEGLDPNTFGGEVQLQKAVAQSGAGVPVNNGLRWSGAPALTLNAYAARTFLWMFLGLLTTFVTAFAFCWSGLYIALYLKLPAIPYVLMIGELVTVIALSAGLSKLSVGTARVLFFLYAVLNGVTFSYIFAMYLTTSVLLVFGVTALYFGVLAAYGWLTKRDLTRLAPILLTGAIVMAVFWVLSMFLNLSGIETVACFVGLAIFMGFTAYDTQKIKAYYLAYGGDEIMASKASVICALQLYLDFINLFLYVLRLLGRRK